MRMLLNRAIGWAAARFVRRQDGQGMVEYGLILALIAIVCIVALTAMGGTISNIFSKIQQTLQSVL